MIFRYAVRGLRRKPGFAAAVILTLALGIGANATMFGIIDRLLFRPPAYMQTPDRVHRVNLAVSTERDGEFITGTMSYKRYLERLLRETYNYSGTPIKFSFRDEKQIKANREKEQNQEK